MTTLAMTTLLMTKMTLIWGWTVQVKKGVHSHYTQLRLLYCILLKAGNLTHR
jgi:hypothetical protein